MAVDVVLGLQRGDEGKGREVDELAKDYDIVARFNGGPNAGHSVVADGQEYALHQIPSGIIRPGVLNLITNSSLLDPEKLAIESADLKQKGIEISDKSLVISYCAHLILPHHVALDMITEDKSRAEQGTTKKGIRYAARDKYERVGIRAERLDHYRDLHITAFSGLKSVIDQVGIFRLNELREKDELEPVDNIYDFIDDWVDKATSLKYLVGDTDDIIAKAIAENKAILAEGAQGFGLDINRGQYPYVTSSSTGIAGVIEGLGVGPSKIGKVYGVAKLLKSHVGDGSFVTEILDDEELIDRIRGPKDAIDGEWGKTTGRPRRVGYPDLVELRRAVEVNGVTELVLTKLDCLTKYGSSILIATGYEKPDGTALYKAPSSDRQLKDCQPIYTEMPLWDDGNLEGVEIKNDLPSEAINIIDFIEAELGVDVSMVGIGPERDQLIDYTVPN